MTSATKGAGFPMGVESLVESRVVTLLFTDIEGSTRMVHALGDRDWAAVLADHHDLLRRAFGNHGGREVKTEGDSFFVVFATAAQAIAASIEAQRALAAHAWPEIARVTVRMGLHTGSVQAAGDDVLGLAVHEAARIADAGHGGQVLISQATRDAAGSLPDVTFRDLGSHALKDFLVPQRIFQASDPGLGQEFPPLRTLSSVAHNLPAPPTPLVGREAELERAVTSLLGSVRVLTISGPGGVGKSRLAVEAARRVLPYYPGGVWFVALADISDPDLVLAQVNAALGLPEQSGLSPLDVLAQHVSARDRILILLDNVEQLMPAAPDIARLAASSELITLLVTSRQRLRIRGEQGLEVGPLHQDSALLLFQERCRDIDPDFAINDTTQPLVQQVCRAVDGVPLALELAAARIRLGLPALVTGLAQGLDVLSDGPVDLPHRQQALTATIEWSYRLLTAEQREAFAGLAVFARGADPDAAAALIAPPSVLMRLVDQSLLRIIDGRWTMLQTIRQFALDRLEEAGRRDTLQTSHARWFRDFTAAAQTHLGGSQERTWMQRLDLERANLNVALDRLSLIDGESMARMAVDLGPYWEIRGSLAEGSRWLQLACEAAPPGDTALAAELLHWSGRLDLARGNLASAHLHLEGSLALQRERGDDLGAGRSLNSLGDVERERGNYQAAQNDHEAALGLFTRTGDLRGIGVSHHDLGAVALRRRDFPVASTHLARALDVLSRLGDERRVARVRLNLGYALTEQGHHDEAVVELEDSLGTFRAIGDQAGVASGLLNLGLVHFDRGDLDAAATLWSEALIIQRERGNRAAIEQLIVNLGATGRYTLPLLLESLPSLRERGAHDQLAPQLFRVAQSLIESGERSAAVGYLAEAAASYASVGKSEEAVAVLLMISDIAGPSSVAAESARSQAKQAIASAAQPARMIEELLSDARQNGEPERAAWLLALAASLGLEPVSEKPG